MKRSGFTLIELSIVLMIIGFIIGGVVVGRDLISAAEVRAQITQIEKYNSAVNTFRGKFNAIPGDMNAATAAQFGFVVGSLCDGSLVGFRDGNGLIDGDPYHVLIQTGRETALFWQDISSSAAGNLIEGQFPNSGAPTVGCAMNSVMASGGSVLSGTGIAQYFPVAKIGHANYLYVYDSSGANWFGLSALTALNSDGFGGLTSNTTIPTLQAYKLDNKIDDGLPTSGNVQAAYVSSLYSVSQAPNTATSGGNSTSCYDTTTGTYSVTYNRGSGSNCALSFKMQGAGP